MLKVIDVARNKEGDYGLCPFIDCVDVVGLDRVLVDQMFISKIDRAVKQSKSSCCNVVKFLGILTRYLSDITCRQLFALFKQVIASGVLNLI